MVQYMVLLPYFTRYFSFILYLPSMLFSGFTKE